MSKGATPRRKMSPYAMAEVPQYKWSGYLLEAQIEIYSTDEKGLPAARLACSGVAEFYLDRGGLSLANPPLLLHITRQGTARMVVVRSKKEPLFYFQGTIGYEPEDLNLGCASFVGGEQLQIGSMTLSFG